MIGQLVIFGATGDLAGRFLFPALAALRATGAPPLPVRVVGAARQDWDDDRFRRYLTSELAEHAADVPADARAALVESSVYRAADVSDAAAVARTIRAADAGPVAVYLALPQGTFASALRTLHAAGLATGSRVALENPFGDDLAGARALNALLRELWGNSAEQDIVRVDHVLGMATVPNLLGIRLANRSLSALWSSEHIRQIDILWEETLALEGRAGFYDRAGALRDVMQNHMMQILAFVAMEPPESLADADVRDAKVAALRSVRPLAASELPRRTQRARYSAGRLAGTGGGADRDVPSYTAEEGVEPDRGTETFAEINLELDAARWAGTRFRLRAGKALSARRKGVLIRLRPSGDLPASEAADAPPDTLWIGVDGPNDLTWHLTGRAVDPLRPAPLPMTAQPPPSALPPYARVLTDLLSGGSALSVRADEVEEAWRIVDPVLAGWAAGDVPLGEYRAGSSGPSPLD